MNKIPYASQNTEAKSLPADICIFGRFGRLSPAAVNSTDSDLTPKRRGGSMFHPMSHIHAKTPFRYVETVANSALNRRHVVVFDRL